MRRLHLGIACLWMMLSACSSTMNETCSPTLLFFAAASTTEAVGEIVDRFEAQTGWTVRLNLAASSALAQQILAGGTADLFLSANRRWADELRAHNFVQRHRDLLGNRLVVIVPAGSSRRINEPRDLLSESIERLSIADPEGVPAGIYAKQALDRLGLWESLQRKIARGFDVRQTLLFVEQGEAEAGIVYSTDAAISNAVRPVLELDASLTDPICYPLLLLKPSTEAERLFEYVLSAPSLETFRRYGFSILEEGFPCETGAGK